MPLPVQLRAVFALLCFISSLTSVGDEPTPPAVESWTDPRLPVTPGLMLWLDASRHTEAQQTRGLTPSVSGDSLDVWLDGSGHKRDVSQVVPKLQPLYLPSGDFHAIRFDGQGAHLRRSGLGLTLKESTVFIVSATYSNPEPFSAWVSMSEPLRNDFETGLNIDQAVGSPPALQVVNIEGAGHPGQRNVLNQPIPYGSVVRLCVTSTPGKEGTALWINGKRHGARDRTENSQIQLDEFVLGARRYTLGGPPGIRGFLHGDIAEVMIFDRILSNEDRAAVETYLEAKYGTIPPLPVPTEESQGKPLERVSSPPPVQVLLPGFAVKELPVDLPNINNILVRPDGKLLALGYDGNVWLLTDTDDDGLEDRTDLFWENKGQIRAPIGMDLTPPDYSHGKGVFVASKGKCSLLLDTDSNDRADKEVVIAEGWKELPHGVDALGLAVDPVDGSVYFGLGAANFTNAYLPGPDGKATYDIQSERGTILRIAPDFKSREIICTGIRFPVGLRFNKSGSLFCTDQEGATWLANGNPLDELLHIQKGRHYGFPPRHPQHLPNVIDEPSTFDYGPQHQSTCGFCFNEPLGTDGPAFGPKEWTGNAFVTGYSRGKLYRTELATTPDGYIARNSLFACMSLLPADCCITCDGDLIVACHSGGPDWGSGPTGKGRLFKICYTDRDHPQPSLVWAAGPQEVRIEFDRPVDPSLLRDALARTEITAGKYVRAGDRFESLWPGYAVVQAQHRTPRRDIKVYSAQLTPDHRTLVLATDALRTADHYAITLPGMGRPPASSTAVGSLSQHPQIDLDFNLTGVEAVWTRQGQTVWNGWLPSLNLAVSQKWTIGSASHDQLWNAMREAGELKLSAGLKLYNMLRPDNQPGSKLDHEWPPEDVTIHVTSNGNAKIRRIEDAKSLVAASGDAITIQPESGILVPAEIRLTKTAQDEILRQHVSFSTAEDQRLRPLTPDRTLLPWVQISEQNDETLLVSRPKELEGGSWSRGWKIFHHPNNGCAKCHAVQGLGAKIGPDLSNLIHRDYASVMRDVTKPSFAINPDYLASTIVLNDGRVLTGVVRTNQGQLHVGDTNGKTTVIAPAEIEEMKASSVSIMPESLLKNFSEEQTRDLLTYLLTPGPSMPRENIGVRRPVPRSFVEVNDILDNAPEPPAEWRPLRVVLVAGPKDHGPGEHDYPAWLKAWSELLSIGDNVEIITAMDWPEPTEFELADVMVFYQRGEWNAERAAAVDGFLERGGGLVYIHYAVDGQQDAPGFAKRIALAWGNGAKFRHGPLALHFNHDPEHPVSRGFTTLRLVDESYWNLTGELPDDRVLGWADEENQPQPLFWSLEQGKGRVFVSIPGHYSWTFDDPLFRVLLLRGIAWSAGEPVDRFNSLVLPGADVIHSAVPVSSVSSKTRVLMFTQSRGFKHDVVNRDHRDGTRQDLAIAEVAITQLGQQSGLFDVTCTQDTAADFTKENLQKYDIVVFYTSGELEISDEARDYFLNDWLKEKGHGWIGIHAAADTYKTTNPKHQWYWELCGGTFDGHPWTAGETVNISVHDPTHPAMKAYGDEFQIKDEIYWYSHWIPENVRVLMSLNLEKCRVKGERVRVTDGDQEVEILKARHVPVAWCRSWGDGKVYFNNLGHNESTWTDKRFLDSTAAAIRWIRGDLPGESMPNPEVSAVQQTKAMKDAGVAAGK